MHYCDHVFLCRLQSIATHRDHFVCILSIYLSVCLSVRLSHFSVTLSKAMFRRQHMHSSECCHYFYAPSLKGLPGASSIQIGHPSVCLSRSLFVWLSVFLSVRKFVTLTNKLKFWWWYSNQTWTVGSSVASSQFTDITCPLGWGRVKCRT